MPLIRPFKGLRPERELAAKVAELPYDVVNSEEARQIAAGNPISYFHISKPEIDLDPAIGLYDERVYQKATDNFRKFITDGILVQDPNPYYYIYEQTMGDIVQVGLVAITSVDEYEQGIIKKHELTRADKEQDRTRHTEAINANAGPVFLTYLARPDIDNIVNAWTKQEPGNDFTAPDKIRHRFWVIDDQATIHRLTDEFAKLDFLYVADGHHRSASACNVRKIRQANNPNHTGREEYNYFLSVIFPHNQLHIFDYNRIVKDLYDLSSGEFMENIQKDFEVMPHKGVGPYRPEAKYQFGMYMDKRWYVLKAKPGSFNESDPIARLDVSILQNNLLDPILGIKDPRKDKRIDFVGGIRGLKELEHRVEKDGFKIAFSLFPTSIDDLFSVANAGQIMPPKSTWFEPKLRSGLIIHLLD